MLERKVRQSLIEIKEQITRDSNIRQTVENMGYLDFTVTDV